MNFSPNIHGKVSFVGNAAWVPKAPCKMGGSVHPSVGFQQGDSPKSKSILHLDAIWG